MRIINNLPSPSKSDFSWIFGTFKPAIRLRLRGEAIYRSLRAKCARAVWWEIPHRRYFEARSAAEHGIILGAFFHSLYYYGRTALELLLHNSDTSPAVCIPILDMCFHMYLCTRFCVFVMFFEYINCVATNTMGEPAFLVTSANVKSEFASRVAGLSVLEIFCGSWWDRLYCCSEVRYISNSCRFYKLS